MKIQTLKNHFDKKQEMAKVRTTAICKSALNKKRYIDRVNRSINRKPPKYKIRDWVHVCNEKIGHGMERIPTTKWNGPFKVTQADTVKNLYELKLTPDKRKFYHAGRLRLAVHQPETVNLITCQPKQRK